MGWVSKLLGRSKTVDDVFDKDNGLLAKAGGFVNDLHHSDAERARDYAAFFKDTLTENTERSKTRRALAIKWLDLQIWLIQLVVMGIFIDAALGQFGVEIGLAVKLSEVAFSGLMWSITSGVGAFFWGTHLLRNSKHGK